MDAFPICLNTNDVDEIVQTIKYLEPTFGGVNIEDISSPRCFEIERRLKDELNIPVFHDDQHGTAIVVTSGLINALKLKKMSIGDCTIVVNGPGAAGTAITKMLLNLKPKDIIVCDENGILNPEMENILTHKAELAALTNRSNRKGGLKDALIAADVFIGVSVGNIVTEEMIRSMNNQPVVFAMANPTPEIHPQVAKDAGAFVVGTGRSDFPNQINNVLAFPGIFKGALRCRATDINEEMKVAAAYAIANIITKDALHADYVIPGPFDKRIADNVADAVEKVAIETGLTHEKPKQFEPLLVTV